MENVLLYKWFRQELDHLCIPLILDCVETREIMYEGKKVGIFCVADDYIDCIYVLPEYRRNGLATKAVLEWWNEKKRKSARLGIINNNLPALRFWTSIFKLEVITSNNVDTMYKVSRKGR